MSNRMETWVDVTEDCIFSEPSLNFLGQVTHKHSKGYSNVCIFNRDDYRLRKIELGGDGHGGMYYAFKVEKKVGENGNGADSR